VPDPFISTADLVDYVGRGGTADAGVLIAIDSACDIVRTISERDFNAGTATLALDGTGTDAVLIPNRYLPVTAAGTVVVNGGTITDFVLNSNGVLFRGTAGVDPRPVWPKGRQNVTTTITYGYDSLDLPRDVRMVALSIASRLVVQGVASEESIGAVRVKYATAATDLTNGERRILQKYRHLR
jgi:hypothetical protein